MFKAIDSPYLVPFDKSFSVAAAPTGPPESERFSKEKGRKKLRKRVKELQALQSLLYAKDHHAILLVFQAMDAAGKDGTIRAVTSGLNPAGCQVFSFKQPSAQELDHDFLWRTTRCLPERGRIGIFNRSYYEEVLVVRVHPEYLETQRLPDGYDLDRIWDQRFESIREHEQHLARSGTVVLKFWLNVSRDEQRDRFLDRIDRPEKNWKFSAGDVKERAHWGAYMHAYEHLLNATSRPWAPWYAIPADDKPFMRIAVADILLATIKSLGLEYPELSAEDYAEMMGLREALTKEKP